MTKEELEKATGQELIEERDYCGVDGYYGDYLDDVNAEMLKRFNRLAELEAQIEKVKHYLDYDIPHDLINEATTKIWRMFK
jgi:hypothetical protein